MSPDLDPLTGHPYDCDCCRGLGQFTPVDVSNRPGLSAIGYRVGTHARFKQTMLARLSATEKGREALKKLKTRDDDDFAIALLDAWAMVADVLTFYQERIANESYLRTATERLSLLELARLTGYKLKPGVAADTYLAFTVDDDPGTATIEEGTRAQSIPEEGQLPQSFETTAEIKARSDWNEIKPRLTKLHPLVDGPGNLREEFFFKGIATGLKPGDGMMFTDKTGQAPQFRRVGSVTPNPEKDHTLVTVQKPPQASPFTPPSYVQPLGYNLFAMGIIGSGGSATISGANLNAISVVGGTNAPSIFANVSAAQPEPPAVLAFRKRAAILGHNAPRYVELSKSQKDEPYKYDKNKWVDDKNLSTYPGAPVPDTPLQKDRYALFLDNTYPEIVKGDFIVLQDGTNWKQFAVLETADVSKSAFTFNSKVTSVAVHDPDGDLSDYSIRNTTVFCQGETLPLARLPVTGPVKGTQIELDDWYAGLKAGQSIIVCGELDQDRGNDACEHVVIDDVQHVLGEDGFTRLKLRTKLENDYVLGTVKINANVAPATHGETHKEILGSGDGSQANQRFTLKHKPLTHVSASTTSGRATTLSVRVNDIPWRETGDRTKLEPKDRRYATQTDDEGKTSVEFGDGVHGARLPSGTENVVATYRSGIGPDGNVAADKISLLATRPPGVRSVTNPMAASGGAKPESRDEARTNVPLAVLTLDRIVSLQDYQDFARAFAGIGKALATWTWNGQRRGIFVTVAGPAGATVTKDRRDKLQSAMQKAGDPYLSLRVASYRPAWFLLDANVKVHNDFDEEKVLPQVKSALRKAFSFEKRHFGQPVAMSDALAVMQAVAGVVAVDVNLFYRSDATTATREQAPLPAAVPQPGSDGSVKAAELLLLDPRPLKLRVMP